MERKSSWWPRAGALSGLLLLVGSGCMKDLDSLSSDYGKHGGAGGGSSKAGASGHGATGGSSGAGDSAGEAGAAGVSEPGTGGSGATGGKPVEPGGGGGGHCAPGSTHCGDMTECTDLKVGDPHGKTVDNCGECGTTCSVDNAASATCQAGVCVPNCNSGFDDCNAATNNDGCEADIATITNCGACGKVCSLNGTSSQECLDAKCSPTCADRHADCNASLIVDPLRDDGCEVYLDKLDACTLTDGCDGEHVACGPLQVCNAGSCVAPQGVAVLSTPLALADQKHRFADLFAAFPNLEGRTITIRAYAPGATAGYLVTYMSDNSSGASPLIQTNLTAMSDHWVDITIPVITVGTFTAKSVKQINLELWAGPTGPWLSPMTVVYVDSILTSDLAVNDKYDTSYVPFVQSSQQVVPGSTLGWLEAMP